MFFVFIQIVTANCVPIKSVDNMATNGVAHVVTSRLPDASRSIYEIVANDPSFSTLKTGTQYMRKACALKSVFLRGPQLSDVIVV